MNFKSLRGEIEHLHRGDTSLQVRLNDAFRALEDALGVLSRYGHHFHLEEGHEGHQEFPKYVYHYTLGQRRVRSEWELRDLGFGWYSTPRDAEYAEGLDQQFAGRGGVRRRQLPQPRPGEGAEFIPVGPSKSELKESFIKERSALGRLPPIRSDSKSSGEV